MKKLLYLIVSVLIITSCSSPKYTYNFDYYDYNSGKKAPVKKETVAQAQESPLAVDETTLVASAKEEAAYEVKPAAPISKAEAVAKLKSMSKEERKELKAALKSYVKESKKSNSIKEAHEAKGLGGDLKLAAIFGAIGIVLLIIGGDALSIIGGISLLVGLFFLIRYLINQ